MCVCVFSNASVETYLTFMSNSSETQDEKYGNAKEIINAVQYETSDKRTPLLPPNRFIIQGQEKIISDISQARTAYRRLISLTEERRKKRSYLKGSRYTNIFSEGCDLLESNFGSIQIKLSGSGNTTTINWRTDGKDSPAIRSLTEFYKKNFSRYMTGNCRQNCDDVGHMYVYGMRTTDTSSEPYKLNKHIKGLCETALIMSDFYKRNFSRTSDEIKESNKHKKRLNGMEDCIVSEIISAKNQINAAHVDCNDKSMSLSTWVEEKPGTATGWAFILPNVTRDGKKAIAIKLCHGRSIEWDGRLIRHCSTLGSKGTENNVYGYYNGAR